MYQEAIASWARVNLDGFDRRYGLLIINGPIGPSTTARDDLSRALDYEPTAFEELETRAEPHHERSSPHTDTANAGVLVTCGVSVIVWWTRHTGPIRSSVPSPADPTTASSRIHTDAAKVTTLSDAVLVSVRATRDGDDPTPALSEYVYWAVPSAAVWRVPDREEHDHWGKWDPPRLLVKPFIPAPPPQIHHRLRSITFFLWPPSSHELHTQLHVLARLVFFGTSFASLPSTTGHMHTSFWFHVVPPLFFFRVK